MPINRRYPLAELRKALAAYPLHKRRFFLVEYVLIKGMNDSKAAALQLAEYLAPLKVRVNLIAYNPGREESSPSASGFARVDDDDMNTFSDYLTALGLFVVKRWSKGQDLMAGCGQLSARNTPGDPHTAVHTHT
jgi:23S rRNA (adenine2503-C2)-methyltransferase